MKCQNSECVNEAEVSIAWLSTNMAAPAYWYNCDACARETVKGLGKCFVGQQPIGKHHELNEDEIATGLALAGHFVRTHPVTLQSGEKYLALKALDAREDDYKAACESIRRLEQNVREARAESHLLKTSVRALLRAAE
jgi:hypothetical protein